MISRANYIPILIGICIGIILFVYVKVWYNKPQTQEEAFEVQKIQEEIELEAEIKKASDTLCPIYDKFLTQAATMIDSTNPKSPEAISSATATLIEQAGGTLFPCPQPEDVLATPADIGERTSRTITYFDKTLKDMIGQIESALSNCPKEGFEDICTAEQMKQRAAAAASAASAATTCKPPQDVPPQDKILILKTRKEALSRVLNDPAMESLLKKLPDQIKKLEEIKKQAEDGTLKMTC